MPQSRRPDASRASPVTVIGLVIEFGPVRAKILTAAVVVVRAVVEVVGLTVVDGAVATVVVVVGFTVVEVVVVGASVVDVVVVVGATPSLTKPKRGCESSLLLEISCDGALEPLAATLNSCERPVWLLE